MTANAINTRVAELTERVDALETFGAGALTTVGTGLSESPAGTVNLSATNVTKLANTSGTNSGDQLAGTGLTGTTTLNVIAHADGSIVANANDIQVGVLASDAQHGARGGGTQHSAATTSTAGFMPATDKAKLDGLCVFVPAGSSAATLQAAIDSLSGVGTVFLEKGTYALSTTTITLDNAIILQGAGQAATFITYTGTGTAIQVNSGAGTETLKVSIRDLTVDGTNSSSGGAYGITLGDGTAGSNKTGSGIFINVTVKRCKTAGVRLNYTALATWIRCTFESNRDGVWGDGTNDNGVTTQSFISSRFTTNVKRGVFFESANSILFSNNCQFEDNGEEGALFKHNGSATATFRNVSILESYFEDNGTAGAFADLRFDNASTQSLQNMRVRGSIFSGVNADGNIWFGKGTFLEEDNEFLNVSTSCCIVSNSTVAFVHSRATRDPTTLYTLGANAPTTHERRAGNGTYGVFTNRSGTLTKATEIAATGQLTVLVVPTVYPVTTGITAFAGGGQGSAVALTRECCFVSTVASANDSVKLPTPAAGMRVVVHNDGANSLNVFPASGHTINALSANTAIAIASTASLEFWGRSATAWRSK